LNNPLPAFLAEHKNSASAPPASTSPTCKRFADWRDQPLPGRALGDDHARTEPVED